MASLNDQPNNEFEFNMPTTLVNTHLQILTVRVHRFMTHFLGCIISSGHSEVFIFIVSLNDFGLSWYIKLSFNLNLLTYLH